MTELKLAIICAIGFIICIVLLLYYWCKQKRSRVRIIKTGHMIIEIRPKSNDDRFNDEIDNMYQAIDSIVKEKENNQGPPC